MSTRPSATRSDTAAGCSHSDRRCRLAGGRRVFALPQATCARSTCSVAAQNGVFDDFVAMDQDEASLAVVAAIMPAVACAP